MIDSVCSLVIFRIVKKYLLFLQMMAVITVSSGQENSSLEYAVVSKQKLYFKTSIPEGYAMGINRIIETLAIRAYDLQTNTQPIITDLNVNAESLKYQFPDCWLYRDSYFYVIGFNEGGLRMRPGFGLITIPEEVRDTLLVGKENVRLIDSIEMVYQNQTERFNYYTKLAVEQSIQRNSQDVTPLKYLLRNLEGEQRNYTVDKGEVCYDLAIDNDNYFNLFIRDSYHFAHWRFNYNFGGHKGYKDETYWDIVKAYTKDSIYLFESKMTDDKYMPISEDFSFTSISDLSFFEGFFKVVRQDGRFYIINTTTGSIYIMDENQIKKIAEVDLRGYKSIAGRKLFIEDLDQGKLLFFSEVERVDFAENYPEIEILGAEEISERFGLVK